MQKICPGFDKNSDCKKYIIKGKKTCGEYKCRGYSITNRLGQKTLTKLNLERQLTGKKGEYKVIGRLLGKGYPIYTPLMDIEGIDCIIRNDKGLLLEIQVKSTGKNNKKPYKIVFKWDKKARKNYVFIFYVEREDSFWIIPSEYLAGENGKEIYGPDKNGKCSIDFAVSNHKKMYEEFKDNWSRL